MTIGLEYIPKSVGVKVSGTSVSNPTTVMTCPNGYTAVVCYVALISKKDSVDAKVSLQLKSPNANGTMVSAELISDTDAPHGSILKPISDNGFIVVPEGGSITCSASVSNQVYANLSYKLYRNITGGFS